VVIINKLNARSRGIIHMTWTIHFFKSHAAVRNFLRSAGKAGGQ